MSFVCGNPTFADESLHPFIIERSTKEQRSTENVNMDISFKKMNHFSLEGFKLCEPMNALNERTNFF